VCRQDALADRLLEFLTKPEASGKKSLAEKVGEKRARAVKKAAKKAAASGKKKKAKAKAPAPAGLKRPKSAYILYCDSRREKVRAEHPEANMIETTKILAEKWNSISDERKEKYKGMAAELKAEYDKKVAAAGKSKPAAKKAKVQEAESDDGAGDSEEEGEEARLTAHALHRPRSSSDLPPQDDDDDDEEEGGGEEEPAEEEPADDAEDAAAAAAEEPAEQDGGGDDAEPSEPADDAAADMEVDDAVEGAAAAPESGDDA
jgi:hypothetical protein